MKDDAGQPQAADGNGGISGGRETRGLRIKLAWEVAYALRNPDAYFPAKRERLARWAERRLRPDPRPRMSAAELEAAYREAAEEPATRNASVSLTEALEPEERV